MKSDPSHNELFPVDNSLSRESLEDQLRSNEKHPTEINNHLNSRSAFSRDLNQEREEREFMNSAWQDIKEPSIFGRGSQNNCIPSNKWRAKLY